MPLTVRKGDVQRLLHKEASHFLKHMATALYRACFCRGSNSEPLSERSHIKWKSGLGFDDGAPLASFMDSIIWNVPCDFDRCGFMFIT